MKGVIKLAERFFFLSTPCSGKLFAEVPCQFTYYNGFSLSQKQKSILSMHEKITNLYEKVKVLEISTKSTNTLGIQLSAFNLILHTDNQQTHYSVENVYQSSKVFQDGGPYRDLLYVEPKAAKGDPRLKTSGKIIQFEFNNMKWDIEPKTMFYDWLYINALNQNPELAAKIMHYNAFTDIEFNQKKSVNCQARAAAIYVSLRERGLMAKYLADKEKFKTIYQRNTYVQTSLF